MRNRVSTAMGWFAGVLVVTGALGACGVSKTGIGGSGGSDGGDGGTHAEGGTVGSGGAVTTGGTAGTTSRGGSGGSGGTAGSATGGSGTGGAVKGGAGGTTIVGTGGSRKGGAGGTTIIGTGGTVKGTGGSFMGGAGGTTVIGTGGAVKGGAGGNGGALKGGATGSGGGTGGAPPIDAGTPDAQPPKCTDLKAQADCDARDDCHSVFEDMGTCGCATPGCCMRFASCASGQLARCTGLPLCERMPPTCDPPYVVAYSGSCYEGCVHQDDCDALPCSRTAPAAGSACTRANGTCYYEDCAGAGRARLTCTANTWQIESAACGTFTCDPGPTGTAVTCAAGEICVLTTSTSFNVTATCKAQTCGTAPITTSCVPGLTGSCSISYSVAGTVVKCSMPMP